MATKGLNPGAPEFVPSSYSSTVSWGAASAEDVGSEDHITPEELEELELAEAWVEQLVKLEEEEEDHLVAVALRYAPHDKVEEIQRRCGVQPGSTGKMRHYRGIRARGPAAATGKAV